LNSFKAHENYINRLKQSPFNSYVASVSDDAKVKIWNPSSNENASWTLIRTYSNHTEWVDGLEFISEDLIATGSDDNTTQIWSISTGQTLRTIYTGSQVFSLKLLNDASSSMAIGLQSGEIKIFNVISGQLIYTFQAHSTYVFDLVLINSNLLASSSADKTIRLWNLPSFTCKFNLTGHTDRVRGLKQISFDILASGSWDATIKLWNITTGELIRTLTGHTNRIHWSLDLINNKNGGQSSTILVSGSMDETVKLWNWSTGECLRTINATGSLIWSVAVVNRKIGHF
jgi:WD40 repeat protein